MYVEMVLLNVGPLAIFFVSPISFLDTSLPVAVPSLVCSDFHKAYFLTCIYTFFTGVSNIC